jgi:hypothetical protein
MNVSKSEQLMTVRNRYYLIHMLAKQDTPMNASRTVLGRVPASARTRVISTRSILVLLRADEMVKPPINSMIVGENMMEKTYLKKIENGILEMRS